jgi:hypothetical protein
MSEQMMINNDPDFPNPLWPLADGIQAETEQLVTLLGWTWTGDWWWDTRWASWKRQFATGRTGFSCGAFKASPGMWTLYLQPQLNASGYEIAHGMPEDREAAK